ncbi:hypothetical protein M427DRAFT_225351 [Gonapodya prolifera JEL478]|uniref:C2H2-type domain-containing protein n=1 Tax=Gonapodya prolifera (strain JEL478) TaxID=1344416 RepID=A0A139ANF2_GONPJ|nr:hypothetical protein M427DRAFT_225351 [Gonapodya prolifera JEL478]|eukprot:KXS18248.1 hypothetical protein M427DRAFT_225351 [Gonapodya prolifera JEL478]
MWVGGVYGGEGKRMDTAFGRRLSASSPANQFSLFLSNCSMAETSDSPAIEEIWAGNSRTFRCSTCGRTATRFAQLLRHAKTHTGVKAHWCTFCQKGFGRRDNLLRHLRCTHSIQVDATRGKPTEAAKLYPYSKSLPESPLRVIRQDGAGAGGGSTSPSDTTSVASPQRGPGAVAIALGQQLMSSIDNSSDRLMNPMNVTTIAPTLAAHPSLSDTSAANGFSNAQITAQHHITPIYANGTSYFTSYQPTYQTATGNPVYAMNPHWGSPYSTAPVSAPPPGTPLTEYQPRHASLGANVNTVAPEHEHSSLPAAAATYGSDAPWYTPPLPPGGHPGYAAMYGAALQGAGYHYQPQPQPQYQYAHHEMAAVTQTRGSMSNEHEHEHDQVDRTEDVYDDHDPNDDVPSAADWAALHDNHANEVESHSGTGGSLHDDGSVDEANMELPPLRMGMVEGKQATVTTYTQ